MDDNYYDEKLKRPVTKNIVDERNKLVNEALKLFSENRELEFITDTIYEL
jgi:hypothetical protein